MPSSFSVNERPAVVASLVIAALVAAVAFVLAAAARETTWPVDGLAARRSHGLPARVLEECGRCADAEGASSAGSGHVNESLTVARSVPNCGLEVALVPGVPVRRQRARRAELPVQRHRRGVDGNPAERAGDEQVTGLDPAAAGDELAQRIAIHKVDRRKGVGRDLVSSIRRPRLGDSRGRVHSGLSPVGFWCELRSWTFG
jgi:hypothetical protein